MTSDIVQKDISVIIAALHREVRSLEGKTVLITGGAGFIGSYFIAVFDELNKKYFKKPCTVISLDNYLSGSKLNILGLMTDKHIKHINFDVVRPIRLKYSPDFIIHAAGIASPVYYMAKPLETIEVATRGTQNILELSRLTRPKSVLFFSSSEIYGDPHPDYIPTPETYRGHVSSTGPRACYGESKRLGETLCVNYHRLFGVPIKIVRPFNIYGPGMKPNDYRVLPRFLTNALKSENLPIHGQGKQTRTYCYVTDAMIGFFKILLSDKNGEVYNIGNDQNEINLINLAKLVVNLTNNGAKAIKIPYPAAYPTDEPNRRCPDIRKASRHLGFKPRVELKDGLARLLNWYRDTYPELSSQSS